MILTNPTSRAYDLTKNVATIFLALLLSLAWIPGSSARANKHPRLVVYISVDQMRPDYFERFQAQFTGGLRRLYSEGLIYSNADLNYAMSGTGPGHAVLSTGAYPKSNGILSNQWVDQRTGKVVYCVEDNEAKPVEGEGGRFSPKNLVVSAIGDWLKSASPQSKVIAIAGKDRSAVLMGGKRPDYAFWYDSRSGHMVTSDYYTKLLPGWVKTFNLANWTEKRTPSAWTKLLPEEAYKDDGPDDFHGEMPHGPRVFPHRFFPGAKAEQQEVSPFWDLLVLDFALEAIKAERLGQREVSDLLCIGLSAQTTSDTILVLIATRCMITCCGLTEHLASS